MGKLSNRKILDIYLSNGLIRRCVECQFAKIKNEKELEEDFFQDLCLIILEYDNDKLNDAHINNHFNAWLTRVIQNQLFSSTSQYYKNYKKFSDRSQAITKEMEETLEDD